MLRPALVCKREFSTSITKGFQMADASIAADKIAAYRATHYRVGSGPETFILFIDVGSCAVRRLYKKTGYSCGVFITAFNPFGQAQCVEANEVAQSRLEEDLRALGSHIIAGVGANPSGTWPEETSVFALGIDKDTARQLGQRFHQDAVVWMGPDAIPQLLLLR
jgi:Protein of unknown function (DUF3293)